MILDTGSNKVITSENFVNDEQNFKIGNLSVILEILHSKLYSNPMKAMIQEIISNAVDANKENNQENTPIEITFPNVFSNSFSIKDNGIGIDKNRMADIFINYGSSTKRNTNDQIGCFGIGAKSPFAYSDNFTIETITKDGFKRIYFAYVGENKIGKMNLISEEKTEENTGTKIIITCKKDDEPKFINYVAEITRYFPIKPIIKNTDENIYSKFKEDNVIYTHNNASLIATEYYGQNNNQIIIGNIPYPLPEIKNQKAIEFLSRFYENKCRILLRYNTGQIAVSASREPTKTWS
jgi:HSP90 family molecular chaperone